MRQLIQLKGLGKSYGKQTVLNDLSLSIAQGEFLTLLGPSGSGKSTTLMMLAGLIKPSCGRIELDGRDITQLPAERRNFGVVFQGYALFPHMTVAQNVAYPLRLRKRPADEVKARVASLLQRVGLADLGQRRIAQLSGGQQQRAALARALVFDPKLLLLDEPLSALDRRLRQEMQEELVRIQRELGTTFLLVTHDQQEALMLSDRIALLHQGYLQQLGTPQQIYLRPNNVFVARFLGDANLLPVTVQSQRHNFLLCDYRGHPLQVAGSAPVADSKSRQLMIRPEHMDLCTVDEVSTQNGLCAILKKATYLGTHIQLELDLTLGGQLRLLLPALHRLAASLQCGHLYGCHFSPQYGRLLPV